MRIKALVSAAILVISLFAVTGTANAGIGACNSRHMCMWGNNDFTWLIGERRAGQREVRNLTGARNNEMDSWANRSGRYVGCMFGGRNGLGDRQRLAPASRDGNVAPWNSDEVSSWRTARGC